MRAAGIPPPTAPKSYLSYIKVNALLKGTSKKAQDTLRCRLTISDQTVLQTLESETQHWGHTRPLCTPQEHMQDRVRRQSARLGLGWSHKGSSSCELKASHYRAKPPSLTDLEAVEPRRGGSSTLNVLGTGS